MRNRLLGLVISTSMLAAGAAFAADQGPTMPGSATPAASTSSSTTSTTTTTTEKTGVMKMSHAGVVKSFDATTHMLTLKDGSSFVLDESLKGEDLKADQKISFNYKTDGQTKTVTDYKIAPKI